MNLNINVKAFFMVIPFMKYVSLVEWDEASSFDWTTVRISFSEIYAVGSIKNEVSRRRPMVLTPIRWMNRWSTTTMSVRILIIQQHNSFPDVARRPITATLIRIFHHYPWRPSVSRCTALSRWWTFTTIARYSMRGYYAKKCWVTMIAVSPFSSVWLIAWIRRCF